MELQLKSITHFGKLCPSKFNYHSFCGVEGWFIHITIQFTKKGETKTNFTVTPPLGTPVKLRKGLTFKTNSYNELCGWLDRNKEVLGITKDKIKLQ